MLLLERIRAAVAVMILRWAEVEGEPFGGRSPEHEQFNITFGQTEGWLNMWAFNIEANRICNNFPTEKITCGMQEAS